MNISKIVPFSVSSCGAGGIPNEAGEFIYTDRQLALLIEKFTAIANHEGAPGEFKRLTADIRKATHHTFNTSLVKFLGTSSRL